MKYLKLNMLGMMFILAFTIITGFIVILNPKYYTIYKVLALLALIYAFILLFNRDTFLPFLGYAALPSTVIKDPIAPADSNVYITLNVDAPDNTKLIYWGAKASKITLPNPWLAYNDYENAGVSIVKNKQAQIRFHCPAKYKIPYGQTLNRHIHYRLSYPNGIMSPVETKYVEC